MRTKILILFGIVFSINGFGQDKNFDLSQYKFPDYKRHELEFNLNSSGYGSSYTLKTTSTSDIASERDFSSGQSISNTQLTYAYNFLTRKRIDFFSSSLTGRYEFSKMKSDDILKRQNPSLTLFLSGSRESYWVEDRFFWMVKPYFYYNGNQTKQISNDVVSSNSRYRSIDAELGFGLGYGRIEKVSDLVQSYYILENLNSQKLLKKDLTQGDVYDFARFISKLKNERFFDFRLRRISELKSIDSLFSKGGLTRESGIDYFTSLNDYWSYANFYNRESGKVVKAWIAPKYERFYSKNLGTGASNSEYTSLVSNVNIRCSKQINLFWERILDVWFWNDVTLDDDRFQSNIYPKNTFHSQISFGYGFYPDTRTYLSGSLNYDGNDIVNQTAALTFEKKWSNRVGIHLSGYYFISPQFQLSANCNFGYYDQLGSSENLFNWTYDLGIRYAIF